MKEIDQDREKESMRIGELSVISSHGFPVSQSTPYIKVANSLSA